MKEYFSYRIQTSGTFSRTYDGTHDGDVILPSGRYIIDTGIGYGGICEMWFNYDEDTGSYSSPVNISKVSTSCTIDENYVRYSSSNEPNFELTCDNPIILKVKFKGGTSSSGSSYYTTIRATGYSWSMDD